jgi:hypothetical protein
VLRVFGPTILGALLLALWAFATIDVIVTEGSRHRNLPKLAWLAIVVLVPPLGPLAWLALGRPRSAAWRPGATAKPPDPESRTRYLGPEDDPDWGRPA